MEQRSSQGNVWHEGFFQIEPTNNDFQIVIEATSSAGLTSDIAIDDVTLMKNGDCIKYSQSDTTETTESEGIFEIQSCTGRCMETESVRENGTETYYKDGHVIERCDCHPECYSTDLNTCCFDYIIKCEGNR